MANKPEKASHRRGIVIILVLLTLILGIYVIWRMDTSPTTDDAYAYTDTISVTPEVSGRIVAMNVRDNQAVKQGDILFRIDERSYQDNLAKAEGALAALEEEIVLKQRGVTEQSYDAQAAEDSVRKAEAAQRLAAQTLNRQQALFARGFISAQAVDNARDNLQSANDALASARAQAKGESVGVGSIAALVAKKKVMDADLSLAKLDVEHTLVRAPFDGRVIGLSTTVGQFVSAGQQVFTLADNKNWFVVANFRESQLEQLQPGQKAKVYLMANTRRVFDAQVESVGYGVVPTEGGISSDGGLPQVERSLNWVRVAQRFPVRIKVTEPDGELFRIGASAVAVVLPESQAEQSTDGVKP
ncbi:multidrug transporter subunit MdtN [Yersinia mollaretii]|uniref:multidrug transporter subunit MdtN n=1 Tax=Yersinia mollaretii TaxID=33060 RepID=UPI0005DB3CAF|nr:multidrug transporter subunit MdtN [Yersinia mollaretii]MDA5525431.1 multidrug transporter subunit MdtN [Yersinia mollaretii]MDR7872825.1 multidrug transporter subunit MdtN [Yersinia mollaretii]PHZ33539.1 multidrug transporter subunit MdtN [Yersinia mollaretii]WQC75960.1 multidrug transporter subunit MdtN [Yersinia mollaretii]CNE32077.1 multidrug resistance protein MdtN [Yersinia mollaretii]